jgi:hypothetical protein
MLATPFREGCGRLFFGELQHGKVSGKGDDCAQIVDLWEKSNKYLVPKDRLNRHFPTRRLPFPGGKAHHDGRSSAR